MTRRAWPSCTPASSTSGARRAASRCWKACCASGPSPARSGSATRGGPPTAGPPRRTPIPTPTARGTLVVVHNGILENYLEIKERLLGEGHVFRSETDTEVLAHLVEHHVKATGRLESAVKHALAEVRGSYAIGVVAASAPDRLVAAKHGAGSVVVGLGRGEMYVASDIPGHPRAHT